MVFHEDHYTNEELQALVSYLGIKSYTYDPVTHTLNSNYKGEIPSREKIKELVIELRKTNRVNELLTTVLNLANDLNSKIKIYITSKTIDKDQEDRYAAKRRAVLNNNIDFFKEEAELLNVDPQELFNNAKNKVEVWQEILDKAYGKIDALRIKLESLIKEDQLDLVEFIINDIRSLETIDPNINLISYFEDVSNRFNKYLEEKNKEESLEKAETIESLE